jgi:hypothetical protein
MPQECAERLRLSRNVGEALDAVYALRNRMDTENFAELIQARAALSKATRGLESHVIEHKCET